MAVRDEIVWRSGIVYFAIALLAVSPAYPYSYPAVCSAWQMVGHE